MKYERITVDPAIMGGVPWIRSLRIPAAAVVEMVAQGMDRKTTIEAFPDLQSKDITQAPRLAADALHERRLPLDPG